MNLIDFYHQVIKQKQYKPDDLQIIVLRKMQKIADYWLNQTNNCTKKNLLQKLFNKNNPTNNYLGLYCYGGVGRGKTFLIDLFFDYLPTKRKKRWHFHRFMLEIHQKLNSYKNKINPINLVIKEIKQEIDILFLDECFVSDIADAMLLSKIFDQLEKQNISLITTSNIAPNQLYKNGLQRDRFLPAINWLEKKLMVHYLESDKDYRQRHLTKNAVFLTPNNQQNNQNILNNLLKITNEKFNLNNQNKILTINTRKIKTIYQSDYFILFDFMVLCGENYSQKDYINLAKNYHYLGIINLIAMDYSKEDAAKRFLLLIDEFYDRSVKLFISSNVPIEQIYNGNKLKFEYKRLQSRLTEMQSDYYWQQPYLP